MKKKELEKIMKGVMKYLIENKIIEIDELKVSKEDIDFELRS